MAKDQDPDEQSETRPLLGSLSPQATASLLGSGESASGALPVSTSTTTTDNNNTTQTTTYGSNGSNGISKVPDDPNTDLPPDEESALLPSAPAPTDREQQFQGMPEVRKQIRIILPSVAVGIFLSAADMTLVASSAGAMSSDLRALKNTSWIATSYFLTLTSFQPLYGKLSDIFGRKPCLLIAYSIFAAGCLWCGLARSMTELIIARALAGVGGGGMTTVTSILMSDIIPLRERGTYQGYINIIYAVGASIGAPLGGALADSIGWRWAFIAQFPLCAAAFASVFFALKLPKKEQSDWKTKLKRIDFLGAVFLVAAISMLLVGLDQGSNQSWKATSTVVCLSLSVPLFGLFVFVEQKVALEPFAPGRVIFERSLVASYLCNMFSFGGWFGVLFYVPLYYQAVEKLSATAAGVRLLPGIFFGVSGSLFGGFLMQTTGRYYWLTVGAYTLLFLAGIPIMLFTGFLFHSTLGISLGLAAGGFGNGIGVTTSLIALISNASPADQAIATACSYLFRSLGSVIGLSVQAALFQGLLRKNVSERLAGDANADEIAEKVRESLDYIKKLSPELQFKVRAAYGESTTAVFGLVLAIISGSMIASFFIKEKRLSK